MRFRVGALRRALRLSLWRSGVVLALAAAVTGCGALRGRGGSSAPQPVTALTDMDATRAQLTAAAADFDRRGDAQQAAAVRARLANGDFRVGDQFEVTLTLDSTVVQQFQVRDSLLVQVPPFGNVRLAGVLRSELLPTMQRFYNQYYRNPTLRVQPLLRIGFLGAVSRPGYYSVRPDAPLADAFRGVAGGPASNANLKKIEVKRDGQRLYDRGAYERAARDGLTFDQLAMRSGDAVDVPVQRSNNRLQTIRIVATVLSVFTTVLLLVRSAANNY